MFRQVLVLSVLGSLAAISVQSPDDIVGGRKILVGTSPINWFQARQVCIAHGKRLLEIQTADENREAVALLKKYNLNEVWFGLNDLAKPDEYVYSNGIKSLHGFWALDSYDGRGGEQDCMTIASEPPHPTNWFDRECKNKYSYFCEDFSEPFPFMR